MRDVLPGKPGSAFVTRMIGLGGSDDERFHAETSSNKHRQSSDMSVTNSTMDEKLINTTKPLKCDRSSLLSQPGQDCNTKYFSYLFYYSINF